MSFMPCPTIGSSPIQAILLVDHLTKHKGLGFESTSLPGHLLHVMTHGRVRQEMNGRRYDLNAPCIVWYHEDERVAGQVRGPEPWTFFTVNFIAPELPPPAFERRVRPASPSMIHAASELLHAWRDQQTPPVARSLRTHAGLLKLLAAVLETDADVSSAHATVESAAAARLWWDLEATVRKDLSRNVSLSDLERLSGQGRAGIARSCHAAMGTSPMRRIKQVRLSLARGLVQRSTLSIKEVAARVGYPRIHEFSRDYHRHFGRSPREDRRVISEI